MAYVLALVGCSNTCRFRSTGQEVAVSRLRWDSRPVRLRQRSCPTLRPAFIVVCIAGLYITFVQRVRLLPDPQLPLP